MHGVNLDLLRTLPHHPDGRPKDPHAHHRADHHQALKAARVAHWQAALVRVSRLLKVLALRRTKSEVPCP